MKLDYRDARPIYAQIIDSYREQIAVGILTAGDKLPSVRELASQLSINPNTIQRAYRTLEVEGWIATVPGKGCFVCNVPSFDQRQKDRLFTILENTAAELAKLGVTRQEVIRYLQQEGDHHA